MQPIQVGQKITQAGSVRNTGTRERTTTRLRRQRGLQAQKILADPRVLPGPRCPHAATRRPHPNVISTAAALRPASPRSRKYGPDPRTHPRSQAPKRASAVSCATGDGPARSWTASTVPPPGPAGESSATTPRRSVRSSPARTGHRAAPRPGSGLRGDISSCLSRPFAVPPQHPRPLGSNGGGRREGHRRSVQVRYAPPESGPAPQTGLPGTK
jgi:hypothetical protein